MCAVGCWSGTESLQHTVSIPYRFVTYGRGKADAAEGMMKDREGQLSIERYGRKEYGRLWGKTRILVCVCVFECSL